MIYRNDNIKITDTYVLGTLKDLKEYFRYEIANQSMSIKAENDIYNYIDNVKNIIEVIENLQEDEDNDIYKSDEVLKVVNHPMGGFYITTDTD